MENDSRIKGDIKNTIEEMERNEGKKREEQITKRMHQLEEENKEFVGKI